MNEKIIRFDTRKNNRNRIIEKIFSQNQKNSFNSVNYKINVQDMLKKIKLREVRNQFSNEYDSNYTWISKMSPQPRRKKCVPQNLRLETLRNTQRDTSMKKTYDEDKIYKQQFSLNSNTRFTTIPNRFDSKQTIIVSPITIKDTVPVKEQSILEDQIRLFNYNNFSKFSSWSRKSSKSLI
ncbi:unnamed protein product (macronuclear) [Paramecium tetraurelia]|uniref:Uncharacterized protein n=1 Tax=Paramecium tetraurelia TaxID=5888 RepID=A0E630_PARTE|nr:uncharacterized protein GSPATT00003610001 [Paramecium tetraurelia]CAK90747.1 unnamed protein product [Paramecium tetraurelia]|eukprot:XP_001458144.1 hypothetical protein (macronuclear) [Paramecium tetraurelia strain d4-2]